jgi:hypothetical protein
MKKKSKEASDKVIGALSAIEKAFGSKPKKGYKFTAIEVTSYDTVDFKGLDIGWAASGIGFGHVTISWGVSDRIRKEWPKQYGFHCDTECMSQEFVEALIRAAAPKIAELITKNDSK